MARLADKHSFDELCAMQRQALVELADLKASLFPKWSTPEEREAVKCAAEVRGAHEAYVLQDALFFSSKKEQGPDPGAAFAEAVRRELGADPALAVLDLLRDGESCIAVQVLDKIALSENSGAIITATSTILGMEPGVHFHDRPFRLKSGSGPDPVADAIGKFGGIELAREAAAPAGMVAFNIAGEGWSRYFAFPSHDVAQQAIMSVCFTTGEMVIGDSIS
jgi:hypothetical protein